MCCCFKQKHKKYLIPASQMCSLLPCMIHLNELNIWNQIINAYNIITLVGLFVLLPPRDKPVCLVGFYLVLTQNIALCDSVDPTRLLLTFNVSVNLGDKYHKNTALHWAVLAGNTTVISLLLDANANVDAQNIKVVPSHGFIHCFILHMHFHILCQKIHVNK